MKALCLIYLWRMIAIAGLWLGLVGSVCAANLSWTNLSGGEWNTGANWSGGTAPGTADSAFLTNQTASYTVNYDLPMSAANFLNLTVSNAAGNNTTLIINTNGFIQQTASSSPPSIIGKSAAVNVTTGGRWTVTGSTFLQVVDGGQINVAGGRFTNTASTQMSVGVAGTGTVTVTAGTFYKTGGAGVRLGESGGTGIGLLNIYGGNNTINALSIGLTVLDRASKLTVTGGVLNTTSAGSSINVGFTGQGVADLSSGLINNLGTLNIGNSLGVTGTVTITGGTWIQLNTATVGVDGKGTLDISGGSFIATNSSHTLQTIVGGSATSPVSSMNKTGGNALLDTLVVNTNGFLTSGTGQTWNLLKDFNNRSTQDTLFNMHGGTLVFTGAVAHIMQIAGGDFGESMTGTNLNGWIDNFAMDALQLASSSDTLMLTDPDGGGGALYLNTLLLPGDNTNLVSNISSITGLNIYYNKLDTRSAYLEGMTYGLTGGGFLIPIPEPGPALLFAVGSILLFARKRIRA